jgi:hypothetical protein
MSKRTFPSVAPMLQVLRPHGLPETVIVVLGTGIGIAVVTINVATRSALTKRIPVCLWIVNIANLLVSGLEGGLQSAPPVSIKVSMVVDGDILAGVLVPIHHRLYFLPRYHRTVRLAAYAEP